MIRFRFVESIAASPDAVFAVMSDINRFEEWLAMDGRPRGEGPVGVGARFDSTSRLGPWKVEAEGEVTHYEPGHRMGFRLTGRNSIDFETDIRLEASGRGTTMTGTGWLQTHGRWRLLEPILRMELEKGEAAEARRLKAIVEAAEAARPAPVGAGW